MPANAHRITLLIHALNDGGAERQMSSLANHLSRHGFACTLITLDDVAGDRYSVDAAVKRVGLKVVKESRSIVSAAIENRKRILAVRQAIQQSQPDRVISFCDKMNIVALAACRTLAVPVVISERSDPRYQKLGWLWEAGRRWYYPGCAACVVQTASIGDYLRPIVGPQTSIEVIPSAIDPPATLPNSGLRQHDTESRLLFLGRLSIEKGPDRLLQAWSALALKHPAWRLTFVGDGPLREKLESQSRANRLQNRVEFLGRQSDVWPWLADSQAFVLPSRYEGFPAALIEAMYAGLPVVATDCSDSIRELIQHQHSGLISDNDLESLSVQLDRLLSDAPLRARLAVAARERASSYRWSHLIARWIRIIDLVPQRPQPATPDMRS